MLEEFLTLDRLELVVQACTQLCAQLDNLGAEMDANDDAIALLRRAALRGLELTRAAIAALDDDVVDVDATRKIIDADVSPP